MIKRFTIFLALSVLFTHGYSQKVSISGYVTDAASGEIIIGATITTANFLNYSISNSYGYYLLTLNQSEDSVKLQTSYVGYSPSSYKIKTKSESKG